MQNKESLPHEHILSALRQGGLIESSDWLLDSLAGDGSDRMFFRVSNNSHSSYLAVLPAAGQDSLSRGKALAEAGAAFHIGSHLCSKNVPVPAIHLFEARTGLIVFEDLGNTLLQKIISETSTTAAVREELYLKAVALLFHMQTAGREGFDPSWCWDGQRYDRQLMLTRESGYFLQSFCREYLGIDQPSARVEEEFELLAERSAQADGDYFLHRDFQSRNLMVADNRLRVIDFQGGRLGPLAYDLASLLNDPYTGLETRFRNYLLDYYMALARNHIRGRDSFLADYYQLALQRNLQILGAFAFLDRQKNKTFFRSYLKPAALSLHEHLAMRQGADYPNLRQLAATCLQAL